MSLRGLENMRPEVGLVPRSLKEKKPFVPPPVDKPRWWEFWRR